MSSTAIEMESMRPFDAEEIAVVRGRVPVKIRSGLCSLVALPDCRSIMQFGTNVRHDSR